MLPSLFQLIVSTVWSICTAPKNLRICFLEARRKIHCVFIKKTNFEKCRKAPCRGIGGVAGLKKNAIHSPIRGWMFHLFCPTPIPPDPNAMSRKKKINNARRKFVKIPGEAFH